jgi:spore coat polysaccharide biosynthesis predicted glycosyltransferase SpsG/RimJ/RimL family protein N-acetyltransferase
MVLRADGGDGRGIGHVVRCLALADAWRAAGGTPVLAVNAAVAERSRMLDAAIEIVPVEGGVGGDEDRATTAALLDEGSWLVVDGYLFPADFPARAGAVADRTMLIDDHGHGGHLGAAVVLDQNPGVDRSAYADLDAGSTLLLGPGYSLLRPAATRPKSTSDRPERLLVVLGGDPTRELVALVAETLTDLADLGLTVDVMGGGDLTALDGLTGVTVHGFVVDPGPLFARADIALAAAGTTSWELCRHGVPSVVVAAFDNQVPVVEALTGAGAALSPADESPAALLRRLVDDPVLRTVLAVAGARLVDGRGAARVVSALRSRHVALRPVSSADDELLWHWANDPAVRAAAFDTRPIPWDDHRDWLERRLSDPNTAIYVADQGDGPWGQIRFEWQDDGVAVVDVSVAASARGSGLAAPLIRAGVRQAFADVDDVRGVRALVRPENAPSAAAFLRAGLTPAEGAADVLTFEGGRDRAW